MKLLLGWLMVVLALAVTVRAENAAPEKKETAAPKRELVWPEIKDPQALIDFAKAEITRVGATDKKWGWPIALKPEFAYLGQGGCFVQPECMIIVLDTHPVSGQALLILPAQNNLSEKTRSWLVKIEETKTPEIKRVLGSMITRPDHVTSIYSAYEHASVRWGNFQNLSLNKITWPVPKQLGFPTYPLELAKQGVGGDAVVELLVAETGSISILSMKVSYPEFESAVREAAQYWRFEPGVDMETRLPAATRMSLTVKFFLAEN